MARNGTRRSSFNKILIEKPFFDGSGGSLFVSAGAFSSETPMPQWPRCSSSWINWGSNHSEKGSRHRIQVVLSSELEGKLRRCELNGNEKRKKRLLKKCSTSRLSISAQKPSARSY